LALRADNLTQSILASNKEKFYSKIEFFNAVGVLALYVKLTIKLFQWGGGGMRY